MSRDRNRRFHEVTVEPSASALLEAVSQAGKGSAHSDIHDILRHEEASPGRPLPSYFSVNFNFKPDSTHDCKKGALFQPGPSRNSNADWQLELESNEHDHDADSTAEDAGKKKPAHVFTGPQTAAKAYDLVLVWDQTARVYRIDRIASTLSLKYERSKTTLSTQSHEVWTNDAAKAKKRSTQAGSVARSADRQGESRSSATSLTRDTGLQGTDRTPFAASNSWSGELKLRSKASTVMAPVRRSSRRSIAVEMEEFDDRPEAPAEPPSVASVSQSKRSSLPHEDEPPGKAEAKKAKLPAPSEKQTSPIESAGSLRRSRRRSSQAQAEEPSSPPPQPPPQRTLTGTFEPTGEEKDETGENLEADDDDLALELEKELEREIEIEMEDVSESNEPTPAMESGSETKRLTKRSLSPVSRLKFSDRQVKIDTPKAHTPDPDDVSVLRMSSLSKCVKRSISPSADRSTPVHDDRRTAPQSSASIGLGLQQTGVGITPTASPHLDVASPVEASQPSDAFEETAREDGDEDEDDDLDDFAAELDMSLAEVPDAPPVAAPAVVEKRRSSRAYTATQNASHGRPSSSAPRQVRKAYGLGGPRQEEEELEDSD